MQNVVKICNETSFVKFLVKCPDVCGKLQVCSVGLVARSPYGPPAAALRAPCGYLASALVFVENLRPPQGRHEATVRHHFKGRTAAVTYVTATLCDRGNTAAAV